MRTGRAWPLVPRVCPLGAGSRIGLASNSAAMSHREIKGASEDARCESSEELDVVDIDPASFRPEGVYHLTGRLTAVMSGELQPSKKGRLTPNIKALIVTAVLFTTITLAQVAAARIANSQALLMDCISMGVDALTYMGNIWVECRKQDGAPHEGSQVIVCLISLSCLVFFTWTASQESLQTIAECRGLTAIDLPDNDVNGNITLAFGAGGVVFDILSLWAFCHSRRCLCAHTSRAVLWVLFCSLSEARVFWQVGVNGLAATRGLCYVMLAECPTQQQPGNPSAGPEKYA